VSDLRVGPRASAPPGPGAASLAAPAAGAGPGFGAVLGRALGEVNELQLRGREAAIQLATGRAPDLAATLLAIEKANVSFQFAVQIRNKLLEAYQEIMRMPV
jgi:flagellar hook-basal body complex protein FliE